MTMKYRHIVRDDLTKIPSTNGFIQDIHKDAHLHKNISTRGSVLICLRTMVSKHYRFGPNKGYEEFFHSDLL